MNIARAKQIIQAKDNIDVYFKGRQVWLNEVNNDKETIVVRDMMSNNEEVSVKVAELNEGQQ